MATKPFLLKPAYKDYLWGGTRLNDEFAKDINCYPLAETWECSTHPDGLSIIDSGEYKGKTLRQVLQDNHQYLGSKHKDKNDLPILVKFIDAKENLSVQVHPDDTYAKDNENGQLGKSEMWYVLDARKDTTLVYGLNKDCSKQEIRKAIEDKKLTNYLSYVPVKKNDIFFINAGTIHAINQGALVAEIQENSNLTYRLYDYDRLDSKGNKRQLDIDKALDVANLKSSIKPRQPIRVLKYKPGCAKELLCSCKYFQVYRMLVNTDRKQVVKYYSDDLTYKVLLCTNGCGTINYANESITFYKGDCLFVPANCIELTIHGQAQFLDIKG